MRSGKICEIVSKLRTATGMNSMKNVMSVKNIKKTITKDSRDFENLYFVANVSTKELHIYAVTAAKPNGKRTIEPIFLRNNQERSVTTKDDIQNLVVKPKRRPPPFII